MIELVIALSGLVLGLLLGWWRWGASAGEGQGAPEAPVSVPVATGKVEAALRAEIQELRRELMEKRGPSVLERVVEKVLPAPPPMVVEKTVETVREVPRGTLPKIAPWKVEFVSGSGRRILGREVRQDRRVPTLVYVGMDGLRGAFTQDHQKADGTWVYRRVSVER